MRGADRAEHGDRDGWRADRRWLAVAEAVSFEGDGLFAVSDDAVLSVPRHCDSMAAFGVGPKKD